jgi:hypothetical protein
MKPITLPLILLAGLPGLVFAQMQDNQERSLTCDHQNRSNGRNNINHCEMKEQAMPAAGRITVDPGTNGGLSVKGWNRGDMLVRWQINTWAPSEGEAAAMVSQIHVNTSGGQLNSSGPDFGKDHGWSVSYEVFVPHQTDVSAKAHNGGIALTDVRGNIDFETTNGGVSLKRLAGTVRGKTVNGGLAIELMGDRWDGTELDASTTNGGVAVTMPANYSAQLETGTVNGRIALDFPVMVQGKIDREISTTIGSGGPRIRLMTTNGGVAIKRKA